MSGMDLHAELTLRYPGDAARVVFITGGASTSAAEAFLRSVTNERVEKPFEARSMRALIQRLVSERGNAERNT